MHYVFHGDLPGFKNSCSAVHDINFLLDWDVHATLQIWLMKCGVLKNVFIIFDHGTKATIGVTKMTHNRNAVSRDFLPI